MVRLKTRWHNKEATHSFDQIAGALAYNIWKIAMNGVLNLEKADFETNSLKHRMEIIAEYLAFSVHLVDRMTYEQFDENERVAFMTELVGKCAKHYEDNMRDIMGGGDYRKDFIELVNRRMAEYAECDYSAENGPSFGMKRIFSDFVKEVLNEKDKQWIGQQIIDAEAPDILKHLRRAMPNLFMKQ